MINSSIYIAHAFWLGQHLGQRGSSPSATLAHVAVAGLIEWWGRRRQAREGESKKEIEMRKTFIAVAAAGMAG